jgi:tetratricopeptide (TPR) repeat protein
MFVRRLPVLLIVLALGVLPGGAQNTPNRHAMFSVGGTLRDGVSHRALENILVTLKLLTGPIANTAYTRANGDFQFDSLPRGDYILEINARDYDSVHETITISDGSRMGISIFLNPTAAKAAPSAAPSNSQMSISAHQLSVPHKAHDEFEKAMSLIYLKADYRAAIAQFQLAIRDFPTYYEAYAEQGSAYYQLKDLAHSEESLQKAIDLSAGQYADALFTYAAIQTDTKHFTDAETTARRAISVDSTSWRGHFELARALTAQKRPEDAAKSAEKSRDLMPDNPSVYLLLANIHIQTKDYAALTRDLDDYLRLSPTGPEADQARSTRERAQTALNNAKNQAAANDDDQDSDDEPADSGTDPQKPASKAPAPDTSGLPSLPAPTERNQ